MFPIIFFIKLPHCVRPLDTSGLDCGSPWGGGAASVSGRALSHRPAYTEMAAASANPVAAPEVVSGSFRSEE